VRLEKLHAPKGVSDIGARKKLVESIDDLDWHSCVYEYFESIDSKLKVGQSDTKEETQDRLVHGIIEWLYLYQRTIMHAIM
jgi:hypothetical protein